MKYNGTRIFSLFFVVAILLFTVAKTAYADTYQLYSFGEGHRANVLGIEDSGAAIIWTAGDCGELYVGCYTTYVNGVAVSRSSVRPLANYDNGVRCTIPVSPALGMASGTIYGYCNNGHEVYGTDVFTPAPYAAKIFGGYDLDSSLVFHGTLDSAYINSSGDFIFYTGEGMTGYDADGYIYEAIDLSSMPEPNSFLLLGTGIFAMLATLRRRLSLTH